jgi:hypothetical protein
MSYKKPLPIVVIEPLHPQTHEVKKDLQQVDYCLSCIVEAIDSNLPPSEKLQYIKDMAITAMKKLPLANYSFTVKYC